jgi:3-oxoadipate enol-lactonase
MIKYDDLGKGETILFIHGLGSHKSAWRGQHELSDTYRLIIPDLRAHGDNTINDEAITMENYASDVIEIIENLQLRNVWICGLSLGGIVAMEIYKQRPDLIKGLILCNTTHQIPSLIGNKVVNASERYFNKSKEELIERIANKSIYNKKYLEETKQAFYISDRYIDASRASVGCDYTDTLRNIDKPTLLIGGYFDITTPPFTTLMMKYLIRQSEMRMLHSGHLSNIERKDEFNYWIRRFIEQNT